MASTGRALHKARKVLDKVYRTPRKNMHLGDMSRERHVLGKPRVISLA